jgi:hypothetical protein
MQMVQIYDRCHPSNMFLNGRACPKGRFMLFLQRTLLSGLSVALAILVARSAAALELTTNGGFETGDFTGWVQFETGAGQQVVTSVNPASGTFAGEINNSVSTSNSLMKQANLGVGIVTPGQTIMISFQARGSFTPGGVAFAEFFSEIAGGGVSSSRILGGGPLGVNANPDVWTPFTFTAIAGPDVSGGVTLQLGATNGATVNPNAHMWYDNVSVSIEGVDADFNDDGLFNCADVDSLVGNIASQGNDAAFDLSGDGIVNTADLDLWLIDAGAANLGPGRPYLRGDANLDGGVDGTDFGVWNSNKFTNTAAWCRGDFSADGVVDGSDFGIWNSNKFTSSDGTAAVPEPGLTGLLAAAIGCLMARWGQRR